VNWRENSGHTKPKCAPRIPSLPVEASPSPPPEPSSPLSVLL